MMLEHKHGSLIFSETKTIRVVAILRAMVTTYPCLVYSSTRHWLARCSGMSSSLLLCRRWCCIIGTLHIPRSKCTICSQIVVRMPKGCQVMTMVATKNVSHASASFDCLKKIILQEPFDGWPSTFPSHPRSKRA